MHPNQSQELGSNDVDAGDVREQPQQPQELHPNQSQELGSSSGDRIDEVREQSQELHPNQSQELGSSDDCIQEVREQPQDLIIDSDILHRLIDRACKVLSTEEWEADYNGYHSALKCWEVLVLDKEGQNIGSLFFEQIQSASFEVNYWFGRYQGYCWRVDENLYTALHGSILLFDLSCLAQLIVSKTAIDLLQLTKVREQSQQFSELYSNQPQELGSSGDRTDEVREQLQELHPNQSQELGSDNGLTLKHIEKIRTCLRGKGCDFNFIAGWFEEKLIKGSLYVYYRCRHPDTRKLLSIYVGKV